MLGTLYWIQKLCAQRKPLRSFTCIVNQRNGFYASVWSMPANWFGLQRNYIIMFVLYE